MLFKTIHKVVKDLDMSTKHLPAQQQGYHSS